MDVPFPSPTGAASSRSEVLVRYLDYFRHQLAAKLEALPPDRLRASLLPTGWTPLQLLKHLTHVERRWLEWGFEGGHVDDPWADHRDGRWYVHDGETLASLLADLRAQSGLSDTIVAAHDLDEIGRPGERWDGAPPATLERVLLHLVQEYARHLGHLDVVVELCGGPIGE